MVLYPGWSARDNYGKRKKAKENPTTGQMVEDYPNNESGSAKKCRAVYGLEAQHLWCAPCRRKKKCVRYPEGDQYGNPVQADPSCVGGAVNGGLFATGSPLHGLHGMLQNSPLSPQLGQASPNSFMSHSPLASMMPDQSTLVAHQHLMSAFGQARNNQVSAASVNPAASHLATLQAHFQNMTNQAGKLHSPLNERHTPQSDDHSAGSGSVGAGPGRLGQINGTIDVKLEEAHDQLSPCVSPEPEEQPLKKIRMDPKCEILNRSSIAT